MENLVELAAITLSAEIYHVFSAVEEILPDLSDYSLGAKDPKWMPLERGSDKTIRDYVLQSYSAEQLGQPTQSIKSAALICPLSFDITSNARTFEIDHFYPKDDILQALEHLTSNQPLLLETKKQLNLLFSKSHGVKATEIVNKLIPEFEQKLSVTGLRHIYFNYPKNLWPISGPTNSSKGKKASLKFAIEKIFESLRLFPGEPAAEKMLNETTISVGLALNSALPITEKIDALSDALVGEFDRICHENGANKSSYILPSHYSPADNQVSLTCLVF